MVAGTLQPFQFKSADHLRYYKNHLHHVIASHCATIKDDENLHKICTNILLCYILVLYKMVIDSLLDDEFFNTTTMA